MRNRSPNETHDGSVKYLIRFVICSFMAFNYSACTNDSNKNVTTSGASEEVVEVYVSNPPPACDATTTITGFTYRPYGQGIKLYSKPDQKSPLVKYPGALSKYEVTLNRDQIVFEECKKGKWSWVSVVDESCASHLLLKKYSECFSSIDRGWILTENLPKDESNEGYGYKGIYPNALKRYEVSDGYGVFASRYPDIQILRRKAAEFALSSGLCLDVHLSQLDINKSKKNDLRFYVACGRTTLEFNEMQLRQHH